MKHRKMKSIEMFLVNEDILGCYVWVVDSIPQKSYLYYKFQGIWELQMKIAFLKEAMAGHLENYIINFMSFLDLSRSLHNNIVL